MFDIDDDPRAPIAYNLVDAAQVIGQSKRTIERAIESGDLIARYPNSKPIVLREELRAWARSLPVDKPGVTS